MRNRSARRGKGNVPSGNKASLLAILHRYQRMSSELEKLQSEVTNIVSGVSLAGQTVTGPFCNRKIQYSDFTAATFVDADFTGSEFDRCRFDETDWSGITLHNAHFIEGSFRKVKNASRARGLHTVKVNGTNSEFETFIPNGRWPEDDYGNSCRDFVVGRFAILLAYPSAQTLSIAAMTAARPRA